VRVGRFIVSAQAWEITMKGSKAFAIGSFAAIAITAGTFAPTVRDHRPVLTVSEKVTGDQNDGTPIVTAQGRCFNGRCF
jgi:hypothetical protein